MKMVILESPIRVSLLLPLYERTHLKTFIRHYISANRSNFIIQTIDYVDAYKSIDKKIDEMLMDMMYKRPIVFVSTIQWGKMNKLSKHNLRSCFENNIQQKAETKITKINGIVMPKISCYIDNYIIHKYYKWYNYMISSYSMLLNIKRVFWQLCRAKLKKPIKTKVNLDTIGHIDHMCIALKPVEQCGDKKVRILPIERIVELRRVRILYDFMFYIIQEKMRCEKSDKCLTNINQKNNFNFSFEKFPKNRRENKKIAGGILIMKNQENNNGLGTVLRLIRKVKEMSIRELAEKMDVSANYLSEIETNKKRPSLEVLTKYSEALGVRKSMILYFDEERAKNGYTNQKLLLEILQQIVNIGAKESN